MHGRQNTNLSFNQWKCGHSQLHNTVACCSAKLWSKVHVVKQWPKVFNNWLTFVDTDIVDTIVQIRSWVNLFVAGWKLSIFLNQNPTGFGLAVVGLILCWTLWTATLTVIMTEQIRIFHLPLRDHLQHSRETGAWKTQRKLRLLFSHIWVCEKFTTHKSQQPLVILIWNWKSWFPT